MATMLSRRRFLSSMALAGITSTLPPLGARAAEPILETVTIKLPIAPAICTMPQMITEQLLQAEGFTDIRFVDEPPGNASKQLACGDVDLMVNYASNFIVGLDKGETTTLLAGVHGGCFVLFGPEDVHGIAGLKGRTVGVPGFGTGPDLLMALMAAEVGLEPKKDLRWIANPKEKPKDLYIAGKIDAFLAFPPEPQELRAKHIGRVIFERPWTGRGRNISAVRSRAIGNLCGGTRSRPSGRCARSSRRRICARPTRGPQPGCSSTAVLPTDMTMRCRG